MKRDRDRERGREIGKGASEKVRKGEYGRKGKLKLGSKYDCLIKHNDKMLYKKSEKRQRG